jgi:hypothetical protein
VGSRRLTYKDRLLSKYSLSVFDLQHWDSTLGNAFIWFLICWGV